MSAKKTEDERAREKYCNRIHDRVGQLMQEQGPFCCPGCIAVQILDEEEERMSLDVEILEERNA